MGTAMSSPKKQSSLLEVLPVELLLEISAQVDSVDDLAALARVNKVFSTVVRPLIHKYDAQGSPGLWPQKPRRILPWALQNGHEDQALTSLKYGADACSIFDLEEAILWGAERAATRLLDVESIRQELNKPLAENGLQTSIFESALINGRMAVVNKLMEIFQPSSPFMASVPCTRILMFLVSNRHIEAFHQIFPVLAEGATLEDLHPPFALAIQNGHQGVFRQMIAQNQALISSFVFQFAEASGRTEMFDLISRHGASMEEAVNDPRHLLFRAALWRGNVDRIREMIHPAAAANSPELSAAFFHLASSEHGLGPGNPMKPVQLVDMLLAHFQLPLRAPVEGMPCLLEIAVTRDDIQLCTYLLQRQPDVRKWGISQPIAGAIRSNQVCELLLDHDVDFNEIDPNDGQTPLVIAASRHVQSWDNLVVDKATEEQIAQLSNRIMEVIESMVICGADPRFPNFSGTTALHLYAESGVSTAVKFLLQQGANPNARDASGCTPLHLAARFGDVETVRMLLDANDRGVQVQDSESKSPLHYACYGDNVETATYLLRRGSLPHASSIHGKLALHLAHDNISEGKINEFIRLGVNPNCQDEHGKLIFVNLCRHLDESHVSVRVMRALVVAGANVNSADQQGTTPLYAACSKGFATRVMWLLGLGAEINALVGDQTALDAVDDRDLRAYLVYKGALTGAQLVQAPVEEPNVEDDGHESPSEEDDHAPPSADDNSVLASTDDNPALPSADDSHAPSPEDINMYDYIDFEGGALVEVDPSFNNP